MKSEKQSTDQAEASTSQGRGLRLIASFKLVQGLLLAMVGTGILFLVSKDANLEVTHWLTALHINTENKIVQGLLAKVDEISPVKFERLSSGAFVYSVLLLTEAIGLLLEKRWAEYMTVLVTGSFLPLELFEVVRHFSLGPLAALTANAAIVWYLVKVLRTKLQQ